MEAMASYGLVVWAGVRVMQRAQTCYVHVSLPPRHATQQMQPGRVVRMLLL